MLQFVFARCQARATWQEQEIGRLMMELSRLEEMRTNHETSIQHLQDTAGRTGEEHERKRDQAAHTIGALTSELRTTKQALEDATKRERQVLSISAASSSLVGLFPGLAGSSSDFLLQLFCSVSSVSIVNLYDS